MAEELPKEFVTTYLSISGWKAVHMALDDECGDMHTPWTTSIWTYKTEDEAITEAKHWSESDGLAYVPRKKP